MRETVEPASRQGMGDSERDQQQREDHSHSEGTCTYMYMREKYRSLGGTFPQLTSELV